METDLVGLGLFLFLILCVTNVAFSFVFVAYRSPGLHSVMEKCPSIKAIKDASSGEKMITQVPVLEVSPAQKGKLPVLDDQNQRLPFRQLILAYLCLATCLFVSFLDVNSTTTSLPAIAKSLNSQNSITWAGTSYLIAQTAFQILYGRLSDIFGRKPVLLLCVSALILGDILCGFAENGPWLYTCRALSGIGGGGISSLVQITVSDLVSLKERGKYQGVLSAALGLGAASGPFIAAALLETGPEGWKWAFWIPAMLAAVCVPFLVLYLPSKPISGTWGEKLKKIDWAGLGTSVVAMLFILVSW
jgi:MFS family permease